MEVEFCIKYLNFFKLWDPGTPYKYSVKDEKLYKKKKKKYWVGKAA